MANQGTRGVRAALLSRGGRKARLARSLPAGGSRRERRGSGARYFFGEVGVDGVVRGAVQCGCEAYGEL